ncbi:hypothetical protein V3O24_00540 [Methylobacter sp. Wu8]|uniref:hypothetical protein n=1 Tax=Methylobacter sp. Wu8 TaxID=3118457 RepID=UPI002F312DDD
MPKFHSQTEQLFAEFLESKGYPKDAVAYDSEWIPIDGRRRYCPDFVLYEPQRKERLAVVEIKDAEIGQGRQIYENLNGYRQAIGKPNLPIYLVARSSNADERTQMKLYTFSENGEITNIDISLFPTFGALSSAESASRKDTLRVESNSTERTLRRVSWLLALMVLCLIVADYLLSERNIKLLTTERLALIGVFIALVVMPFMQKFKGLGIEWEREK